MRAATFIGIIALTITGVTTALAAYTYKCPKCGLINSYEYNGIYRCPSDGTFMVRQF